MKRKAFIFVFIALLSVMPASCAPGAIVQVNTPAPSPGAGTPAPGGQIEFPGVSIRFDAPGPNPMMGTPDAHGRVAGILQGIWHRIISPVTLVLSFVNNSAQIYEVHNDGGPYNLGFFLGIILLLVVLIGIGSRRA